MNHTSLITAAALLLAGCAIADTRTPIDSCTDQCAAQTTESTDPAVELLDKLQTRGEQLKSYQAKVTYDRRQQLLGDEQMRIGTITYQSPQTADTTPGQSDSSNAAPVSARFAVRFTHLLVNEALRENQRSYIFDGMWLAEVDPENKQFIRRQVVGPRDQHFDPLAIGRGPFPVPLGQKRAQVLAIFKAAIVTPAEDDPADSVHLRLTPRTDEKTGEPLSPFDSVDIWYDQSTLLPVRIITQDDSQNTTTVNLKEAKIDQLAADQSVKAFDTTPPAPGSGWKVEIKPYAQDTPAK